MIVYSKRALGLHLLLRLYGSAVVRTLHWGLLAALQTGLLYLVPDHSTTWYDSGRVPAFGVFATAVALLVIFRQNAGWAPAQGLASAREHAPGRAPPGRGAAGQTLTGVRTELTANSVQEELTEFKTMRFYRDTAKRLVESISKNLSQRDPSLKKYRCYKNWRHSSSSRWRLLTAMPGPLWTST